MSYDEKYTHTHPQMDERPIDYTAICIRSQFAGPLRVKLVRSKGLYENKPLKTAQCCFYQREHLYNQPKNYESNKFPFTAFHCANVLFLTLSFFIFSFLFFHSPLFSGIYRRTRTAWTIAPDAAAAVAITIKQQNHLTRRSKKHVEIIKSIHVFLSVPIVTAPLVHWHCRQL